MPYSRPSKKVSKLSLANVTNTQPNLTHETQPSSSRGLNNKKRTESLSSPEMESPTKRLRCDDIDDDEVVIISDSRDIKIPPKVNTHEAGSISTIDIISGFKLDSNKLRYVDRRYGIISFDNPFCV